MSKTESKEKIMKFETIHQKEFADVIKLLANISDEATMEISKDGIKARGMDTSHVSLFDIELNKEFFVKIEGDGKIGFIPKELSKALSILSDHEIKFEIKNGRLKIHQNRLSSGEGESKIELKLIESSSSDTPLPKIKYDILVELDKFPLNTFLVAGDYLELNAKNDEYLIGKTIGDNMTIEKEIKVNKITGKGKSTYSMEYLQQFTRAFEPNLLEFAVAKPLKITKIINLNETKPEFKGKDIVIGKCSMYLAPRVES